MDADYLARVAPAGRLAGRQHIDPTDLRGLLPFVNLIDVERAAGALRFRYRLVGTTQVMTAGTDGTGRYVDEWGSPGLRPRIVSNLIAVTTRREPLHDTFPVPQPGREHILTERVYYPLARDGATVDIVLALYAYPNHPTVNAVILPPRP